MAWVEAGWYLTISLHSSSSGPRVGGTGRARPPRETGAVSLAVWSEARERAFGRVPRGQCGCGLHDTGLVSILEELDAHESSTGSSRIHQRRCSPGTSTVDRDDHTTHNVPMYQCTNVLIQTGTGELTSLRHWNRHHRECFESFDLH